MSNSKTAVTKYPVLDIIKDRWSPRSFSDKAIAKKDLNAILEAATWAFSAMNEQPWRYIVAQKGTPLFDTLFDALLPGNRPWNKQSAALVLSLQKTTYSASGSENATAMHDVGAANILLTLQANSMGIYTHIMAGFDKSKITASLNLGEDTVPVVMIALGYPDDADKLEEPFRTREKAVRSRKDLSEILLNSVN